MRKFLAAWLALLLAFAPVAASAQLTLLGAGAGGGAVSSGTTFIGSALVASPGGAAAFNISQGTAVSGDLIVIFHRNPTNSTTFTLTGSGNAVALLDTQVDGVEFNRVYARALSSSDFSGGNISITESSQASANSPIVIAIYRGPTAATSKGFQSGGVGVASLVFAGFAPAGGTKGVVMIGTDLTGGGTIGTIAGSSFTWASRVNGTVIVGATVAYVLDLLSGYSNTSETFSPFGTSNFQDAYLLELT